ncbi:MAG TPA: arginine deiminase family protein [Thermoplasmata archaeon]|nr:arginine deiminase family protein [Thermoplasmata archaeon]
MSGFASAEWHRLREVLIHRPGIEMFFGLLEPYSFLYERAFSIDEAVYEHQALEHALEQEGVRVVRLKRLAVETAARHPDLVERVRSAVMRIIRFSGPRPMVARSRAALRRNLETFDAETLFNILLLRPRVALERHRGYRVILPRVVLETPLANLYFMRDQQALTPGGLVLGRMSKPQRAAEPLITGTVLKVHGARIAGEVRPPGTFEGGDFLPCGSFGMLGTGDRTNASGVRQFLASDHRLDEVAVVHQPSHPLIPGDEPDPMIDMHLDTYLNIAGEGLAVGCEPLLRRARVEVFERRSRGGFVRAGAATNVHDYLVGKGFRILPITTLEQLSYASNFLCVRDRRIVAVEVEQGIGKVLAGLAAAAAANPHRYGELYRHVLRERQQLQSSSSFFPHKSEVYAAGIEVRPLALQEITGGYGGAHCMTCAMSRSGR